MWPDMVLGGRKLGRSDYERLTLEDEKAVRDRREALGLSFAQAQRLVAENDRTDPGPQSLLRVRGSDFSILAPLKSRRWLWIAAQTSNVSYRGTLMLEALLGILTTGEVPTDFVAHVYHLLDEAPIYLMVMAVEQSAQQSGIPIQTIWRNVERIANGMRSRRKVAWKIGE